MPDYTKELAAAKNIARQAGAIMRTYFKNGVLVERKADDSPVTAADIEINRLVIVELSKQFNDPIIGEEESTGEYGMGRRWICDPIDGTKAFIWGVPTAMFSLGLVVDGVPVMGVAYDPFLDHMYEATAGQGSYCDGKPLHVSPNGLPGEYVTVSSSVVEKILNDPLQAAFITNLLHKNARLACFSGSVYKSCLVARGKFVGYVEKGVSAHDLAAVEVIVKEAGGMLTDFEGKQLNYSRPFKGAIISNGKVHGELIKCVQDI